jgi:hypothetical protein
MVKGCRDSNTNSGWLVREAYSRFLDRGQHNVNQLLATESRNFAPCTGANTEV